MIAQRTTAPGPARAAEAGDVETVSSEIIAQVGGVVQTDGLLAYMAVARRAQYHEAGHAVVAHLLGRRVTSVSAMSDDDLAAGRAGFTSYAPVDLSRARRATIERSIVIALAGGIAERLMDPAAPGEDADDLARIAVWSRLVSGVDPTELRSRSEKLVREHWPAVEAVADALVWDDHLDGRALRAVLRGVA